MMSNGPYRDDSDLVVAARSGDGEAFARLYDAWFDKVYDVVVRIVRNPDIAAEVAQDTFLVTWQKLDTLREPSAFGGWLLRAGRNRALNRLEKERRSVAIGDEETVVAIDRSHSGADAVAATTEEAELQDVVWAASAALGERDASILSLHLRHGLDGAELADELGVSANAANQSMFRLRARLGDAVQSWMLWRGGQPTCPDLRSTLEAAGVASFGRVAARTVNAHAEECPVCSDARSRLVSAEALFASVPLAAAPPGLKAKVVASLEAQGVPVNPTGPADIGATPTEPLPGSLVFEPPAEPIVVTDLPAPGGPVPVPYPTMATGAGGDAGEAEGGEAGLTSDTTEEDEDRRRRPVWWLAAAALILLLPVAGVLLWPRADSTQDIATDTTTTDPTSTTGSGGEGPTRTRPSGLDGLGQSANPIPAPETTGSPTVTTPPDETTSTTTSSTTSSTSTTTTEPSAAPTIVRFSAVRGSDPDLCRGDPLIRLTWVVTDADYVEIDGPNAPTGRIAPADSPQIICWTGDPATYTLTATGPGGTDTETASVDPLVPQ